MDTAKDITVQKRFGQQLAKERKKRGWSQERLSLESGVARSYLGGVERGQRNIALVNICRLAETLGVQPAVLMTFEEGINTETPESRAESESG